jgi:hypothetical protein
MHDTAFHIEQNVLPQIPYRQWTMTFPRQIRLLMASDRKAIGAILSIFIRTLFAYQRRQAKKDGYPEVLPGAVTFVQTFGSALNLNIHFHTLLPDGVFIDTPPEQPITFLELPFPSQRDIEQLLTKIAKRVMRFVDATLEQVIDDDTDGCALPAAQLSAAMVGLPHQQLRAATTEADQGLSDRSLDRCASAAGFSLHANVYLRANDRQALLRLIRYGARQSFSQDRLSQCPNGTVCYQLHRRWGQLRTITLQPVAFLHRLAALIPAPYLHLTRYHGCFAPGSRRRGELINKAFCHKTSNAGLQSPHDSPVADLLEPMPPPAPRAIPWAELLQRTFKIDVLQCPRCPGRLSVIAFITDLVVVSNILAHLQLPTTLQPPAPARLDEQLDLVFDIDHLPAGHRHSWPATPLPSSCRDPP